MPKGKNGRLDPNNIPKHIAVIMDGNGRWAKKKGKLRTFGHRKGTDATRKIVRSCGELGVKILTIFVFSSENWLRPIREVSFLMKLLIEMVKIEVRNLNKNNVRLNAIGDVSLLPEKTRQVLFDGIRETAENTGLLLNLAVSYSGRSEILQAVGKISEEISAGTLEVKDLTDEKFSEYLYTKGMPDPDLMIRTGGDFRISNFLLWQMAYTELFVTDTLWPDFTPKHLEEAIISFQNRERRFGRVVEV